MRVVIKKISSLSFFLIIIVFSISSQTVGLVLSGGGAKGLAHIGVIRALEENNIPIDYVVGTSIGAIVGGLYAIGLSPDEMEAMFKDEKFYNYYKGLIPENHFYYFKTQEKDASAFRFGITKRDSSISIVLPTNLVATQPMDFGILEYFAQYSAGANNDFDSLFVPYRCVASDIYQNRQVVFQKGDLGSAIRASMTFPLYFKPVEIDSVLYFDGGIYNNFPVDVMRNEFDPDFIVGVVVTSNSEKPDPDNLMLQIENLVMGEEKEYIVPTDEGITIKIDFEDISLLDFHKVDELVLKGYDACNLVIDSIRQRFPERRQNQEELLADRKIYKERLPAFMFDKVYIKGLDNFEKEYVNNVFKRKSDKLNLRQLESEYYKLISDFQIERATPLARYNDTTGFFDVFLDIQKEKRMDVFFGAGISTGYSNNGFVGANYKILNRMSILLNSNLYFGRFYNSFHLSGRFDLPFYFPLALDVAANLNRYDFFKGNSRWLSLDFRQPYIVNFETNTRADIFTPLNRFSVIKAGYAAGFNNLDYYQISNFLQTDTTDFTGFTYSSAHLSMVRNNHNFKQYPNKGANNFASFRYVFGTESNIPGSTTDAETSYTNEMSWMQFHLLSDSYSSISKHFTLGIYAEIMLTNKPLFRNYFSSILSAPAFAPTPHSKTLFLTNYRANTFMAVGIKPIIMFTDRLNLRIEAYAFIPYQKILKEEPWERVYLAHYSEPFSYIHLMGTAALVYNSPVGPLSFSVNYYETESIRLYYMLHLGYIIFNKKGFDY
ncbi:MAG TPA: patatin-like phospholipase family protein [Bacteroidales bacterium]|nr:patatin-like phospholipase family protein [Bacteroidales bacterium]